MSRWQVRGKEREYGKVEASVPSLYYGCIKVLEEGSDVGAIRGSRTSKSTFKMISVDPGSTVYQKSFRTHYTEWY